MGRWIALTLLVAAVALALIGTREAEGEGRTMWEFKAVVFTGPSTARGPEPETWTAREITGLDAPMRPYLDDGWEPLDTSWLLGGAMLVTMKRPR